MPSTPRLHLPLGLQLFWPEDRPITDDRLRRLRSTVHTNSRRANCEGCENTLAVVEWDAVCTRFNDRCAVCNSDRPLTLDHVVPTSRGGGNVKENVLPLCFSCNQSKSDRTMEEWILGQGRPACRQPVHITPGVSDLLRHAYGLDEPSVGTTFDKGA